MSGDPIVAEVEHLLAIATAAGLDANTVIIPSERYEEIKRAFRKSGVVIVLDPLARDRELNLVSAKPFPCSARRRAWESPYAAIGRR